MSDREKQESRDAALAGVQMNVRRSVIAIISRITKIKEADIAGDKLIRDDLGVDSMQAIESLAVIEKEFGITIDPDKAFQVATVDDLIALIEASLPGAGTGAA